jgi:hypothetical protein
MFPGICVVIHKTRIVIAQQPVGFLERPLGLIKPPNLPGYDFHGLHGKPKRYTVHVSGPWCVTFEFEEGDAWRVDLEN